MDEFVNRDRTKVKWTTDVLADLEKGRQHEVDGLGFCRAIYRPFTKQWLYSNKQWNWSRHLIPKYFPDESRGNLVICVTGVGTPGGFSALVTDTLPDLGLIGVGQCFPLYSYDAEAQPSGEEQHDMFNVTGMQVTGNGRRYAVTDEGLAHFKAAYPNDTINKEDIFYYVYGLLHSPDYRERYADNLTKELPRIPCVKQAVDFWAFSRAGRMLADLHLNYETVTPYPAKLAGDSGNLSAADYRVEKMRHGKNGKDKDLSTVHYNARITVSDIPLVAYEYVVNGKPAIDWVMERQSVKTDKDSGITNDANDWAVETMGNPRYPLELLLRVITVSLDTMKIVKTLPQLDI